MVARMLRICAAAATPCAWLPEENATTPPTRSAGGIDDSLLKAPRNLNDPVRCSISGFRKTFAPVRSSSAGDESSGVRTATGASTRAAASISEDVTGKADAGFVMGLFYREPCGASKADNQLYRTGLWAAGPGRTLTRLAESVKMVDRP